ncbi:hypothetical protein QYE76_025436 [Lolium multiflorum]|uniref:VQ domain-containing protein n=1 Tax=Lolium multiflorum TaxID=4521 RepID=A0AAD8RHX2_LOLMU|nr:hypothetical protein QYE76_025436 [Lolium multiflorum]
MARARQCSLGTRSRGRRRPRPSIEDELLRHVCINVSSAGAGRGHGDSRLDTARGGAGSDPVPVLRDMLSEAVGAVGSVARLTSLSNHQWGGQAAEGSGSRTHATSIVRGVPILDAGLSPMYSCSSDRDRTGAAERALAFSAQYQPCNTSTTTWAPVHMQAAGQVDSSLSEAQQLPPRRPRRRHSTSASRRSSTTVVATDVSNFRAKVQELTGFPPAAIFRPQPRRAHATDASHSLLAAAQGCGAGAVLQGRSSDAAATTGNGSRDVPAVVHPLMHPTPGLFDGLADLGSPEFDAWSDLSFE